MPQQTLEWWQKAYFYDADPIKASNGAASWHADEAAAMTRPTLTEKRFLFLSFSMFSHFSRSTSAFFD